MDKMNIGQNAQIVRQLLTKQDKWKMEELLEASGLPEIEFYLAVGWLARDNKIEFNHGQDGDYCSLKFDFYY